MKPSLLYSCFLLALAAVPCAAHETDLLRQIGVGPLQLVAAFAGFVALVIICDSRPVWGLATMICYYPFITGSSELGMQQIIAGTFVITFLLLWLGRRLSWRAHGLAGEDYRRTKTTFLFFGVYLFINAVTAGVRGIPAIDMVRDLAPWSGLAMFLFMETFVRKEKELAFLLKIQIGVMAVIAIYVIQWFLPFLRPVLGIIQLKSSFLGILAILLIGAAGMVFRLLPKWLSLLFYITSGFYFILTPTRTHFIVAVLALIAMFALTTRKRRGIVLAVLAGALAVGSYEFLSRYMEQTLKVKVARFQRLEEGPDPSLQSRIDEIVYVWRLFCENPVIGVGVGHRYRLWRHWVRSLKGPGYYYDNFTHSDVMNFLAKLGIIGMALYLVFYYKIGTLAWKLWKTGPTEKTRAAGLVCCILLCAAFVAGQATPIIQTRSDCLFLGFVMGYVYCVWRLVKSNGRKTLVYIK